MKRPIIVNVSLVGPELDYDSQATLAGQQFRLVRRGTSGDLEAAVAVVEQWRDKAAAFAISGVREARSLGLLGRDQGVEAVRQACGDVPVTDGDLLTDVLQEWSIRRTQSELPGHFTNARTLVLGTGNHPRTAAVLSEFSPNVVFADPTATPEPLPMRAAGAGPL